MKDRDLLPMTSLFLASLRDRLVKLILIGRGPSTSVLMCSRLFASAVDEEVAKGNRFAALWRVHDAPDGRRCLEFMKGLDLARQAGIVARRGEQHDDAVVLMTQCQANSVIRENSEHSDGAKSLAAAYLRLFRESL